MKALRVGVIAVAFSLFALPAHAALIGLLGGDFDPLPSIDSGGSNPFENCNNANPPSLGENFIGFSCIFYSFPSIENELQVISSVELSFNLLGLGDVHLSDGEIDDNFDYLDILGSGFVVPGSIRLSSGEFDAIDPNNYECGVEPVFCPGLALYVQLEEGDDFNINELTAQIVAVNNVAVPEPATLLLLGPGALGALLAGRRRRRSQSRV